MRDDTPEVPRPPLGEGGALGVVRQQEQLEPRPSTASGPPTTSLLGNCFSITKVLCFINILYILDRLKYNYFLFLSDKLEYSRGVKLQNFFFFEILGFFIRVLGDTDVTRRGKRVY